MNICSKFQTNRIISVTVIVSYTELNVKNFPVKAVVHSNNYVHLFTDDAWGMCTRNYTTNFA